MSSSLNLDLKIFQVIKKTDLNCVLRIDANFLLGLIFTILNQARIFLNL